MGGSRYEDRFLNKHDLQTRRRLEQVIERMSPREREVWQDFAIQREQRGAGRGLPSQELRRLWEDGRIHQEDGAGFDPTRVQPASWEPATGELAYAVDPDRGGMFRVGSETTVKRALLELPSDSRRQYRLSDHVLQRDSLWVIPFAEKLRLRAGERIKASPKSSIGRTFLDVRLLADRQGSFDEMLGSGLKLDEDAEMRLYALVKPLAFDHRIPQGHSLLQIRHFEGHDAKLTDSEIAYHFESGVPLVRGAGGEDLRGKISEGLWLHLDLRGEHSNGVVALKARRSNHPIDMSRRDHPVREYWQPVIAKSGSITIDPGERYLLVSKEWLNTPPWLCGELSRNAEIALRGELHLAGFIDNNYRRPLVFEVYSNEEHPIEFRDGMPIGKVDYSFTDLTDDPYGERIEGSQRKPSNYGQQVGPNPPKYFEVPDWEILAKKHEGLSERILVQDRDLLLSRRGRREGFERLEPSEAKDALEKIADGFGKNGYEAEEDELVLQPIPYLVVFGPDGQVFSYQRAASRDKYREDRLFGMHSVGVGGHMRPEEPIERYFRRKVFLNELTVLGDYTAPRVVGDLMMTDKPVDRVHYGLVCTLHVNPGEGGSLVMARGAGMASGGMQPIAAVQEQDPALFESWSQALIPHLDGLYEARGEDLMIPVSHTGDPESYG